MSNHTTCLTNVYNERYLLPFWLKHHRKMFDKIIIVDYNSTDESIKICKEICPNCEVITTKNKDFGAVSIDKEFMKLEKKIPGIKVVLNTTEFLFCEKPLKEIFAPHLNSPKSFAVKVTSPYSLKTYHPKNKRQLFKNLLNGDIKFHQDRFTRQVHNFPHGNYNTGRHTTNNPSITPTNMHIIWFGFYPLNDELLQRKLQVKTKIPKSDKDAGLSFQHFFTKEKILDLNKEKVNTGKTFDAINPSLCNFIKNNYNNK